MQMEQTECSETSAYKIQAPENHPEECIQHSEHGESLKSRNFYCVNKLGNIRKIETSGVFDVLLSIDFKFVYIFMKSAE